jgi:hypothetical protein
MNGRLTGAAPTDPGQRDAFYRQGKQPFSVKVGDRWVQYNQTTGPLALAMMSTAAFYNAFEQTGEVPTTAKIAQAAGEIGNGIIDQSFFKGLENLMGAITDPNKAATFVAGELGGLVPMSGAMRNTADALDSRVKDAKGVTDRIKSGIPVLSKSVPSKLDVFGREQQMEGGEGMLSFLPSRIPKDEPRSSVDAEVTRLGIFPGPTGKTITIGKKTFDLDSDQQRELQRIVGQTMLLSLQGLFAGDVYQHSNLEQQQQLAQKVIDAARTAGRQGFIVRLLKERGTLTPKSKTIPAPLAE